MKDCQLSEESKPILGFDSDMFCAAELDCRIKKYEAELEQRPKPVNYPTRPLDIITKIFVESISDISEVNMDFTCTIKMTFQWDNRLLRLPSGEPGHSVLLPNEIIKSNKVWLPDVILLGTKSSAIQQTIQVNKAVRLFTYNGTVVYTVKLTATLSCTMKLKTFPADVELCSIGVHSFSYNKNELRLVWADDLNNASQWEIRLQKKLTRHTFFERT